MKEKQKKSGRTASLEAKYNMKISKVSLSKYLHMMWLTNEHDQASLAKDVEQNQRVITCNLNMIKHDY